MSVTRSKEYQSVTVTEGFELSEMSSETDINDAEAAAFQEMRTNLKKKILEQAEEELNKVLAEADELKKIRPDPVKEIFDKNTTFKPAKMVL